MFPSMQVHVHWVNLMKKQIISKLQKLEILNQKAIKEFFLFCHLVNCLYSFSSKFIALGANHMQKNIHYAKT